MKSTGSCSIMVSVVIFDFDGLVFDSETYDLQSFEHLYQTYDLSFLKEQWTESIGSTLSFDPYAKLLETKAKLSREKVRNERQELYLAFLNDSSPREGVEDYILHAKSEGIHVALASSSTRSWIDHHLKQLGMEESFDYLCTADDVEEVKPSPELYVNVLEHFSVLPEEALVFEDSPNGSLAAIRAGIPCVVIPNETTKDLIFDERIALRLETMGEFRLSELLKFLKE
ncbi:HAD-IA family hydrolase [Halobacillus locisalis]|uniref:HAD-IA family hydrolase n=1 Tax=Halobacillus locisalis TaxID=220753 RepID=A0A838CPL9_9BACI|nr:HAD-IA family hydrolase [Halobacillus locisalis]MBA2173685.1 HAD-IA family hydrolase [Halobacillus locisalis]